MRAVLKSKRRRVKENRANCHAARDGECFWKPCPQVRDNEPARSGRSCPLHWLEDDEV